MAEEQIRTVFIAQSLLPNTDEIKEMCVTGGQAEIREKLRAKGESTTVYVHELVHVHGHVHVHVHNIIYLVLFRPSHIGKDSSTVDISRAAHPSCRSVPSKVPAGTSALLHYTFACACKCAYAFKCKCAYVVRTHQEILHNRIAQMYSTIHNVSRTDQAGAITGTYWMLQVGHS